MSSIINVEKISAKNGTLTLPTNTTLNNGGVDSYIKIPAGTESQRGSTPSIPGAMRFSDEANNIEIFDGSSWRQVKNVTDYLTINFSGLGLNLDSLNPDSYPGSGDKWYNASTNPEYATLFNYTYNSTNDANFTFNGTSTHVLFEVPLSSNLDSSYSAPVNSITQEVWFKVPSNNITTENVFSNFQYGIGTNKSFRLSLTPTGWFGGVNIDGTFDSTTSVEQPFSQTPLSSNIWYNLVHTYSNIAKNISFTASASNGSSVITNVSDFSELYVGQQITGPGLPDIDPLDPATITTIVSLNISNRTITLSNQLLSSEEERIFNAIYSTGNYLYLNGEIIAYNSLNGSISYDLANNNYVTIGAAYEGPGNNTGLTKYFSGNLSSYRLYGSFYTKSDVTKNFNAVKSRFGY